MLQEMLFEVAWVAVCRVADITFVETASTVATATVAIATVAAVAVFCNEFT